MLDIEVELACKDWEEIPTEQIVAVAAEARKQAGEFMPSNGLMAKIWRELRASRHEEAQKAIREANTVKYLAAPGNDLPTAEQQAENARIAAEIAARFADPKE